jgi:hypothetical protein
MLLLDLYKQQIMKITPHKTDTAFEAYDHLQRRQSEKAVVVEFRKRR